MKPEMHDGWGIHDPRQGGTGDREAYLRREWLEALLAGPAWVCARPSSGMLLKRAMNAGSMGEQKMGADRARPQPGQCDREHETVSDTLSPPGIGRRASIPISRSRFRRFRRLFWALITIRSSVPAINRPKGRCGQRLPTPNHPFSAGSFAAIFAGTELLSVHTRNPAPRRRRFLSCKFEPPHSARVYTAPIGESGWPEPALPAKRCWRRRPVKTSARAQHRQCAQHGRQAAAAAGGDNRLSYIRGGRHVNSRVLPREARGPSFTAKHHSHYSRGSAPLWCRQKRAMTKRGGGIV